MRLMIDGGGYATAATAFAEANAVAAMQHDHLVGALEGYAGMAGHDSVGAEFAAAYDEAAGEALAGYADLVTTLATLGHLTEASLRRHEDAERAAVIPGALVYEGGSVTPGRYASVLRATPPSALGGDATSLAPAQEWVLDQLEGIFWPSADTGRLRAAAQTWRNAAQGLTGLTGYADTAARGLEQQLSPEIPLALDAVADVTAGIEDLAAQYTALGDACDAFAANVDARREELLSLLGELLEILLEGAAFSLAAGLLTAGSGAGAAGAATAAKIAARYPRFAAVIALFRSVATTTATTLRGVREALALRRARFVKYLTARHALLGERGAMQFGSGSLARLERYEAAGGHTLSRHVAQSRADLERRLVLEEWRDAVSTYPDKMTAANCVDQILRTNRDAITHWLEHGARGQGFNADFTRVVGQVLERGAEPADTMRARAFLIKDSTMPRGFRVLSSYPIK